MKVKSVSTRANPTSRSSPRRTSVTTRSEPATILATSATLRSFAHHVDRYSSISCGKRPSTDDSTATSSTIT